MYKSCYDKLQAYFGEKIIQLPSMETNSFVLSVKTKIIIIDLKSIDDLFVFSNLSENHELFSDRSKKLIGKFKLEAPIIIGTKNVFV